MDKQIQLGEVSKTYKRKRTRRTPIEDVPEQSNIPEDSDEAQNAEMRTKSKNDRPKKDKSRKKKRKESEEEEQEEEQGEHSKKEYFRTRMSLSLMFDFIQRLSPQQKQAVQEIGFGSILHMQLCNTEADLVKPLILCFDIYKCVFKLEDDELSVEEEDIECTLGLPRGQRQVQFAPLNEANGSIEYQDLLGRWRERWNIEGGAPITTAMPTVITSRGVDDDMEMFKRDFVIFTVSCMLSGHQSRYCNYRILNSLINVDEIKDLNWCSFTYKALVHSIEKFQKNTTIFFTGPVAFIQLIYMDRVQFKGMGIKRTYPTIIGCSAEVVRKRVTVQRKSVGFGKGKVIPRLQRPAPLRESTECTAQRQESIRVPTSSVERVSDIMQRMASIVREFGEAMADIGRQGAPVEVMKKTFSAMSSMFNIVSTMEPQSTPTASQQDDIFFGQDSFLAAVDALVDAFNKTTKQIDPDAPSFDLGISPIWPSQEAPSQQTPQPSQQAPSQQTPQPSQQAPPQQTPQPSEIQDDDDPHGFNAHRLADLVDTIAVDAGVPISDQQERSQEEQTPAPVIKVPFAKSTKTPILDDFDK